MRCPIVRVGEIVKTSSPKIWRVFNHWVDKARDGQDLSTVTHIGIDETSSKKGHNYLCVGVDMKTNKTIHVGLGKDVDSVKHMKECMQKKGLNPDKISEVCMDMSPAFIAGVKNYFPSSNITFDKFHVVKLLNEAIDEVRREERRNSASLIGHKYTFLRNYSSLSPKRKDDLDLLVDLYPKLGETYRLKMMFNDFYSIDDYEESKGFLSYWCDIALDSKIKPLEQFVGTVKSHFNGIMNYKLSRLTSGVIEGLNSKIQLAKRRARGYKNMGNFINMVYFITGDLKYHYPHYPL